LIQVDFSEALMVFLLVNDPVVVYNDARSAGLCLDITLFAKQQGYSRRTCGHKNARLRSSKRGWSVGLVRTENFYYISLVFRISLLA
jgi:hypothetical protein